MRQCNITGCEREGTITVNISIYFKTVQMGQDTDQELEGYFCARHARERWRQFVMKMNQVFDDYPFP